MCEFCQSKIKQRKIFCYAFFFLSKNGINDFALRSIKNRMHCIVIGIVLALFSPFVSDTDNAKCGC